jgi:crotonobetainyl-CoA:carnitine CoA-transferase CaiB-like acyl-CoA transferase
VRHPLDGVLVVALEQAVAAPFATRHLADLGARVIKIERPGQGDFARGYDQSVLGQSSYFVWLNQGKESVEADAKTAEGRALLHALVGRADVFVQNLAPGAAERMGLGADDLRRTRPELIHCSISGYGPDGPYRDKKAYDLLVQCETGLVMSTGTPDAPAKAGISVADIATGMYAYSGILTALYDRERTGHGASLHVAMIDALGEWMSQPAYFSRYGGELPRRTGARHPSISPYGPFDVADGSVFLGIQNEREWLVFCREILRQKTGPGRSLSVRDQHQPGGPQRRADGHDRAGVRRPRRRGGPAAARPGRDRQCPAANASRAHPAPAAARPRPAASRPDARRRHGRVPAAGRDGRSGAGDGAGARAG